MADLLIIKSKMEDTPIEEDLVTMDLEKTMSNRGLRRDWIRDMCKASIESVYRYEGV